MALKLTAKSLVPSIIGNYNVTSRFDLGALTNPPYLPASTVDRTRIKLRLFDFSIDEIHKSLYTQRVIQTHSSLKASLSNPVDFFSTFDVTSSSTINDSTSALENRLVYSLELENNSFVVYLLGIPPEVDDSVVYKAAITLTHRNSLRDTKYSFIRDLIFSFEFTYNLSQEKVDALERKTGGFLLNVIPTGVNRRTLPEQGFDLATSVSFKGTDLKLSVNSNNFRYFNMFEFVPDLQEKLRASDNPAEYLNFIQSEFNRILEVGRSTLSFQTDRDFILNILNDSPTSGNSPIPITVEWNSSTVKILPADVEVRGSGFDFLKYDYYIGNTPPIFSRSIRTTNGQFAERASVSIQIQEFGRGAELSVLTAKATPRLRNNQITISTELERSFDAKLNGIELRLSGDGVHIPKPKAELTSLQGLTTEVFWSDFITRTSKTLVIEIANRQEVDLSKYRFFYKLLREDELSNSKAFVFFGDDNSSVVTVQNSYKYKLIVKAVNTTDSSLIASSYIQLDPDNIVSSTTKLRTDTSLISQSLSVFYTGSQTASQKKYHYQIYNNATSRASKLFSVSYAHFHGSGALAESGYGEENDSPTRAIYRQLSRYLHDLDSKGVINLSGSLGSTKSFYVINFNKAKSKDNLDPGTWQLNLAELSGSAVLKQFHTGSNIKRLSGGNTITLIDNYNHTESYDQPVPSGYQLKYSNLKDSYKIVSGTLERGVYLQASNVVEYGRIYPRKGVLILDADLLDASASFNTVDISDIDGDNIQKIYTSLDLFRMRNTDLEQVTTISLNVRNFHLNYSTNPTFVENFRLRPKYGSNTVSGSWSSMRVRNKDRITSDEFRTRTYATTIGLYDEAYNLLAIGKFSKPQQKSELSELVFTVSVRY